MSGKNSNNHNNSDEKNLNMEGKNYEEYIEQEIIKETYLTEESDMDRIMFLVKEINKINPLKDIDESKSLDEFCKKYNVTVQSNYPKVRRKSIIALVAAMLLILGLSSVVVVGNKFNLFNMDFNDSEKQVHYTSENETVEPIEELEETSQMVTVKTMDEALKLIPFTPLVPHYLPTGYNMNTIQINKISEDFIDLRMDYYDSDGNTGLRFFITYTSQGDRAAGGLKYENDYEYYETLEVLGQDCIVTSDGYNNNATFTFDKAIYAITSSKNMSLSEFKKILESINF